MRRSTQILGPLFLISAYYGGLILIVWAILELRPGWRPLLPFGGLETLLELGGNRLEVVTTLPDRPFQSDFDAITLLLAIVGALLLMVPISWVYFITTRRKRIDRSFAQTMVVLPVIVAGIAMIVQHSLALAFSLAGIVAAVRFRFTLTEPAYTLYVFVAITVGLGAGVSALGISFVTSLTFVYVNLALWKLNYGDDLTSPFFAFLTGRGRDDDVL